MKETEALVEVADWYDPATAKNKAHLSLSHPQGTLAALFIRLNATDAVDDEYATLLVAA